MAHSPRHRYGIPFHRDPLQERQLLAIVGWPPGAKRLGSLLLQEPQDLLTIAGRSGHGQALRALKVARDPQHWFDLEEAPTTTPTGPDLGT